MMSPATEKSHRDNSSSTRATRRSNFKRLDLDAWHLQNYLQLFEKNDGEEPSINIDTFMHVCTRFRCTVKNVDLIANKDEQHHYSNKQYSELKQKMDLCKTCSGLLR